MPNYIKNRIKLIGSQEDIANFIAKFSTFYKREPSKSYDGNLVYKNSKTDEYGWLDQKTNVFTRRNQPSVEGVPKGFTKRFEEAWTRFPDFNKIVPMPEGLSISPHSGIENWVEICTGQIDFTSPPPPVHDIQSITKSMKMVGAVKALQGDAKNLLTFSEEDLECFFQAIKNVRNHGFMSWYDWSIKHWGTKWNCAECKKIDENTFEFDTAWSGVPDLIKKMARQFPTIKIVYKYSDEDTGSNCGIAEYENGSVAFFNQLKSGSKEAYELAFELRPDSMNYFELVGDTYSYVERDDN